MKTWIIVCTAAILGLGVGIGSAVVRLQQTPWGDSRAASPLPRKRPEPTEPSGPPPKVVVDDETHDFGALDSHATGRHNFVFRNVGEGVLKLTKGDTTCKCAASLLGDDENEVEVAPGGATEVTLQWKGKGFSGPFHQSATIHTNDPERRRITLTISGRIIKAVDTSPSELVLTGVSAGEAATGEIKLFGYQRDPLEITGYKLSDEATAEKFDVAFEPLAADEIAKQQDATSGHLIHVTVKPGLPPGTFQQRIIVETNAKDVPTVEVPVRGRISSEISIIGPGWKEESQVLTLGTATAQQEITRTVRILIRGPDRENVQIENVESDPDLLDVSLGEPTEWQGGQVVHIPLTISIAEGSRPASYLGPDRSQLGRVELKTSHPKVPKLQIFVRFAVVH